MGKFFAEIWVIVEAENREEADNIIYKIVNYDYHKELDEKILEMGYKCTPSEVGHPEEEELEKL